MNILLGAVAMVVLTGLAIAAMLWRRRGAPEGSYFSDGDRASGVFGVLATGFSVLLGFIVFLSFTTYDASRAGAEEEAVVVAQQFETAQFFGDDLAADLTGELVCYGRSVVGEEWDRLEAGTLGDEINPWGSVMFDTMVDIEPQSNAEQSAYDRWLDQTNAREQARNDRVHAVSGVIPSPLWIVLLFVSGVIFIYMLFFADRAERATTQALLMGSVVSVITTLLLLLVFFNRPFQDDVGGLRPDSMARVLRIIVETAEATGIEITAPCDDRGRPLDG
jgi:hypothetical protein